MTTMVFLVVKTLHVLSSTVLFGTGLGTAFHMWVTHRRGERRAIAATARNVVLADWLFTTTSGVVQPATGFAMVLMVGYDPLASWLVATYALYGMAAICWFAVVALQNRIANIARRSVACSVSLPPAYYRAMRLWFWLGWPAFLGLVGVFWLMVTKPSLW